MIEGFQGIINTAQTDVKAMEGTQPFGAADAQLVCAAFTDVSSPPRSVRRLLTFAQFVVIHQELLKITIGKSGVLEGIFLGPVAATLRSVEDVVDVSILFWKFLALCINIC